MIHSQATSIPLRALVFGLTATFSLLASSVRAQAEADTINAVASFSILADMVEVVGGDHVKRRQAAKRSHEVLFIHASFLQKRRW